MATDFSSLDKLVEFGLGLGIATQMMNTMNQTISQTAYPGVGLNPGVGADPIQTERAEKNAKQYYIVHKDKVAGPLDEKDLTTLINNQVVNNKTFCWSPGMKGWTFAEDIPEINKLLLLYS